MSAGEIGFSISKGIKGIVETLSNGYNLVLRQIWLLALPVALDVYLWLGPRLSVQPLTRLLLGFLSPSEQVAEGVRPMVENVRDLLETWGQEKNLFALLSNSLVGLPSYLADGLPAGIGETSVVWGEDSNVWIVLLLGSVLAALGLFLGTLYLAAIAQISRQGRLSLGYLLRRVWRYWGLILLFGMLLGGLLFLLVTPALLVVQLLGAVSAPLAELALFGVFGLLLWLWFHLIFVPQAVVNEANLLLAVWNSLIVVARNFWSALFLVLLMVLIQAGFDIVWDRLSQNAPLMALSIAGNAFIGTGLIATALIFYQDRLAQWIEWLNRIRPEKNGDAKFEGRAS